MSRARHCWGFVVFVCLLLAMWQLPHRQANGSEDSNSLKFPAVLKPGDAGPIIYDLHATLNDRLGNRSVCLRGAGFQASRSDLAVENYILHTPRGDLRIPATWKLIAQWKEKLPGKDEAKHVVQTFEKLDEKPVPIEGIKLPPAEAIHSVGIYGEQTFALVMFFQVEQELNPTGEVDAVTLKRLEPLVPSRYPLLGWSVERFMPEDSANVTGENARARGAALTTAMLFVAALAVYALARVLARLIQNAGDRVVQRRHLHIQQWHRGLVEAGVFASLAHFAPALLISVAVLFLFPDYGPNAPGEDPRLGIMDWDQYRWWHSALSHFGLAYLVLAGVLTALAVVDAFRIVFNLRSHQSEPSAVSNEAGDQSTETAEETPISGIVFAAKVITVGVGLILFCAAISGTSPMVIVGSLSVFTAVIIVAFRDTLLGLVASVQIVANEIVKVGDWIEMPKYGANGDVTKISLNMIKVQNFDKTVSTIPTQAVLGEAFRNWSNMHQSGGRRIKRSIYIDMNSIRTMDDAMREELGEFGSSYDSTQTNVGAFRAYVVNYLKSVEHIHDEDGLRYLVRYLQPTEKGLPLEVYAFANQTDWGPFEEIQSEIIEHILAMMPKFDLRVFQDVGDRGPMLSQTA